MATKDMQPTSNYLNIAGAATTLVKGGQGTLAAIIVNTQVGAATITIYDSLTASGTKIGTMTLAAGGPGTVAFALSFTVGLTIVTSGATDITVVYQ